MINKLKLILISSAILIFTAASAIAQTNRAYVADSGSDANLCTRSAQCRTITKALSVVNDGGEVIITESGDYDPFMVTKSVTVAAEPGVDAEIAASSVNAIAINNPQPQPIDSVTIRNLNLKYVSGNFGPWGIVNNQATNLYVEGCTVTGFALGIGVIKAGKLFVNNSIFRNNSFGISTSGPTTDGLLYAIIENSQFEHNNEGVVVDAKSYVTFHNCVMSDNAFYGIYVVSNKAGLRAEAVVDHCRLTGNKNGMLVSSTVGPSTARVSNSTITQNATTGIRISGGAIVYSYQNNIIDGNLTDISGVLTPISNK
jgi:hypothetical protein